MRVILSIGLRWDPADLYFLTRLGKEFGIRPPFDEYDMFSFPEKGDALDAIETRDDIDAVVTFHIMTGHGSDTNSRSYLYNRNNDDLWNVCGKKGILLIHCAGPVGPAKIVLVKPFNQKGDTIHGNNHS